MYDSKGKHIDLESRLIQSGVSLVRGGKLVATTKALLRALPGALRFEGLEAVVTADRSRWIFSAASTVSDTTSNLVMTPDAGGGRWLRADRSVQLKLAIAFGTADAAVLFTTPVGFKLALRRLWWEITADWTGGTASAIGVSSGTAPHATKGDLLGGSGGDVAATLVASAVHAGGTIGADFGSNGQPVLQASTTLRFDRITSAFTAGTGFVHCLADVID